MNSMGSEPEKSSVAVDPTTGNFYTTDKDEVRGFNANGEVLPGFPLTAGLGTPCGVTTDADGNLWVGDESEHQIREYSSSGEILRIINTSSVYEPEFGAGTVCNIAVDKSTGDLYFTLSGNYGANRIVWRLTAASNYSVQAVEEFVVNPSYPGIESIAIDSARHVVYLAEGSKIDAYNTGWRPAPGIRDDGLKSSTLGFDESTGLLYATFGESTQRHILVFDPVIVPDADTGEPTGDSQVSGTIGTAGGPPVTECKFEWGPTKSYGETPGPALPLRHTAKAKPSPRTFPVSSRRRPITTAWSPRTPTGRTSASTGRSRRTTSPSCAPPAPSVERTCATLNGAFEGNGEDTLYNFEWGTTSSYGNTAFDPPEDAGAGTGPQQENFQLCDLQPATTYHFRFIADNGVGPSPGKDSTFTTAPAVIGIGTDPATEIGGVIATINGHWTGDGCATTYYFEWGFSKNYEHSTPVVDAGSGTGPQSGSAELTGLFQNAVYHYRIVVTDGLGTTYGPDRSFRTLILSTFTYIPTKKLTTTSGEVRATVNPENAGPTTYHFEYGPTTSYGPTTPEDGPVGSDNTAHPVSAEITASPPGRPTTSGSLLRVPPAFPTDPTRPSPPSPTCPPSLARRSAASARPKPALPRKRAPDSVPR